MGESTACLMRSYSQPSHTSTDHCRDDYRTALTSSISFGRFATETLDWEKRSAFTQNRNLEEIQNLSKLGTVAQRKAYFEAHHKRIAEKKKEEAAAAAAAAAELLDRNPKPPNLSPQPTSHSSTKSKSKQNSPAVIDEYMEEQQSTSHSSTKSKSKQNSPAVIDEYMEEQQSTSHSSSKSKSKQNSPAVIEYMKQQQSTSHSSSKSKSKHNSPAVIEYMEEQQSTSHSSSKSKRNSPVVIEYMQEQQSTSTDLIPSINVYDDTLKVDVGNLIHHEDTNTPDVEKTPVKVEDGSKKGDLSKSSKRKKPIVSSSKLSDVRPTNANLKKIDDNATLEKKPINSTPKSLHMSMNFGSLASGEKYKPFSPMLNSLKSSRIVKTLLNASKDSWLRRTPIRASVSGVLKHSYLKPLSENKRIETPLRRPVFRTEVVEVKPPSLPKVCFESSRAFCATKAKSPTVTSTFTFKSEERAAKRKEFFRKLDENVKETEKARPPTKSKIPLTRACSPKLGRKVNVQDTTSRPPWKSSVKNDVSKRTKTSTEMNKRVTTHSVSTKLHKRNTGENISPNIPI